MTKKKTQLRMPAIQPPQLPAIQFRHIRSVALAVVAFLVLYIIWWAWLFILFDKETLLKETMAALEQQIGRPVTYSDDVHFSLMPMPQLELHNLQIPNSPRARQTNLILVPKVLVDVNLLSTISGDNIVNLTLVQPRIEVERFSEKNPDWPQQIAKGDVTPALLAGVEIVRGDINYYSSTTARKVSLSDVNGRFEFGQNHYVNGLTTFEFQTHYYQLGIETLRSADQVVEIAASLTDGVSTLSVNGQLNPQTGALVGKQEFVSQDLGNLLQNLGPDAPSVPSEETVAPTGQQAQEQKNLYPVKISGDLAYQQGGLRLTNMRIEGDYSQGIGQLAADFRQETNLTIGLNFDRIMLDPIIERDILTPYLLSTGGKQKVTPWDESATKAMVKGLPEGMQLDLTVQGKEFRVAGMPATRLQLQAQMKNGEITLRQFSGQVPGDTQFLLQGKIDESYEGIALRGQLDVSGISFRDMMKEIAGESFVLPEGYDRFRGRANMFISPRLVRFSEGVLRVEDIQLLGTLIRHYKEANQSQEVSAKRHYEGAFRVENLDLDRVLGAQKAEPRPPTDDSYAYPLILQMMERVSSPLDGYVYDLKFSLPEYTLNKKRRKNAYFGLSLAKNSVAFKDVRATYNGTDLMGGMEWRFEAGGVPSFSLDVKANRLETGRFLNMDFSKLGEFWFQPNGEWSKAAFDLSLLNHYRGDYAIALDNFQHGKHHFKQVKLKGELQDSRLRVFDLETVFWSGIFKGKGGLHASKLPSLFGDFVFNGLNVKDLHSFTEIFDSMTGRFNLSADVTSAGVNVHSMIENAQGSLSVAGGGVTVKGFNLQNMVRAANAVRTVDDIDKLIDYANQGGETRLQTVQGVMNLGNGFLQTPGMKITTPLGSGSVNGRFNLMQWDINAAIILYLQALDVNSPPNIKLMFNGPIQQAQRRLDTESLESFIARQAAKRLLEE